MLHTPVTTVSCVLSLQMFLVFNMEDSSQLVSNSEDTVVFYSWVNTSVHTCTHIPRLLYSIFLPSLLRHLNLQHRSELKVSSIPVSDKVRPLISGQIPRGSP